MRPPRVDLCKDCAHICIETFAIGALQDSATVGCKRHAPWSIDLQCACSRGRSYGRASSIVKEGSHGCTGVEKQSTYPVAPVTCVVAVCVTVEVVHGALRRSVKRVKVKKCGGGRGDCEGGLW